MRVLITIDHPWGESLTHLLLDGTRRTLLECGHEVDVLDLHREGFDPVMHVDELAIYSQGAFLDPKIGEYQRRVEQADYLVFIFPVWWEVMPALLKGFFDKVFLPGWAFAMNDGAPLLTHIRGATVITTMGAPNTQYTSVDAVLCKGILEFCGVQRTHWFNLPAVNQVSPAVREAWMGSIEQHLRALGSPE